MKILLIVFMAITFQSSAAFGYSAAIVDDEPEVQGFAIEVTESDIADDNTTKEEARFDVAGKSRQSILACRNDCRTLYYSMQNMMNGGSPFSLSGCYAKCGDL